MEHGTKKKLKDKALLLFVAIPVAFLAALLIMHLIMRSYR